MRWMSGEGGSGAYFKCKYAMNKENRKLNSAIVLTKKRKGRQTSNTARGVLVGIWFRHEVFFIFCSKKSTWTNTYVHENIKNKMYFVCCCCCNIELFQKIYFDCHAWESINGFENYVQQTSITSLCGDAPDRKPKLIEKQQNSLKLKIFQKQHLQKESSTYR